MPVALYACGFNAHGQLTGESIEDHPSDISRPQCLLTADSVRVIYAGWADTLCEFFSYQFDLYDFTIFDEGANHDYGS